MCLPPLADEVVCNCKRAQAGFHHMVLISFLSTCSGLRYGQIVTLQKHGYFSWSTLDALPQIGQAIQHTLHSCHAQVSCRLSLTFTFTNALLVCSVRHNLASSPISPCGTGQTYCASSSLAVLLSHIVQNVGTRR